MTAWQMQVTPTKLVGVVVIGAALVFGGAIFGAGYLSKALPTAPEASDWQLRGGTDHARGVTMPAAAPEQPSRNLPAVAANIVRQAIKRHDFATATAASENMLKQSRARIWTLFPFGDFVGAVSDLTDPSFERSLSLWVDRAPFNPLPRLVRAQYYLDLAWSRRGGRFIHQTDKTAQDAFGNIIAKGLQDIQFVLTLDPQSAYGLHLRIKLLRGQGNTDQMRLAFEEAIKTYPHFIPSYTVMLTTLQPKWGGDLDAMYEFVDRYSGNAPAGSELNLLPLQLYALLLQTAATACTDLQGDAFLDCFRSSMNQSVRPGLETRIKTALDQFGELDAYETNEAVSSIIEAMISEAGTEAYASKVLQTAATSYHSDPRLTEDKGAKNNFIIDQLVAHSWLQKGFKDNAITKYKEALLHLQSTAFPSPDLKAAAQARIYEKLMRIYEADHQLADMVATASSAFSLNGKSVNRLYICRGYYLMKQFSQAVDECSTIVDDPENGLAAYYWRGMSNYDMGVPERAIGDLIQVASSQHRFRSGAAITLSMIYFGRKDNQTALDVLNRYAYLYDAKVTNRSDVAVAYNNRCYAYMELGDDRRALDDCNASLIYGSIPDALKKKEELVSKLQK